MMNGSMSTWFPQPIIDTVTVSGPNTSQAPSSGISILEGPDGWHLYLEAVYVVIISLIGLAGNTYVIMTSFRITRFAKQNAYIFLGLSLSDLLTCLVRGICLVYMLFHVKTDSGEVVCGIWVASNILVVVAVVKNMVLAIERTMIIYRFQSYMKCFTKKNTLSLSLCIWGVTAICLPVLYFALQYEARFFKHFKSCEIVTTVYTSSSIVAPLLRVLFTIVFGFIPIIIIIICYSLIVGKICKSGLLTEGNAEDGNIFARVMFVAIARAVVITTCLSPFLFIVVSGASTETMFHLHVRFFDYILLLQSMLSPFISMQDSYLKYSKSALKGRRYQKKYGNSVSPYPRISSGDMETGQPN